jgi:hypothetical protein
MFYKLICTTDVPKARKADLCHDGAKFSTRGRDTMRSGTIPSGEHLTGDNESSRVRSEVLEEVRKAVEEDEAFGRCGGCGELVVAESCYGGLS